MGADNRSLCNRHSLFYKHQVADDSVGNKDSFAGEPQVVVLQLQLAAPQIGLDIRVVVIDLDVLSEDFPEYKDFRHVYINPHIVEYDNDGPKESMEEGCLSLPGIHENVTRPTRIHVVYQDKDFNKHDEWVDGYLARVMQHEFDHLEGTMFVDRISPMRKQLIRNKLKALLQGRYRCGYRTKPARR